MNNSKSFIKDLLKFRRIYPKSFSLEIEAEFTRNTDSIPPKDWQVKADHSLRGHGLEYITREPGTVKETAQKVKELLELDQFRYYSESHRTSTHVHYNIQNYTLEELVCLILLYYVCEPQLTSFAGEEREGNLFCLRLCDAEVCGEAFYHVYNEEWMSLSGNFDRFKYAALNIANVSKLGTIEFRQLRGTNDPSLILRWVRMIESLASFRALHVKSINDFQNKVLNNPMKVVVDITGIPIINANTWDNNISLVHSMISKLEKLSKKESKANVSYDFGPSSRKLDSSLE